MADPPATYAELRDLVHATPVGSTVRGLRLADRVTLDESGRLFEVSIERGVNTWTITYMAAPDGGVGRVMNVVAEDDHGRLFAPEPWLDSWVDTGITQRGRRGR